MVLVHDQRNMGVGLASGLDQVLDEGLTRVFAGASTGLQNDRGADGIGRGHDSLHLLQVVDVKSRNAVALDCCMVQQLAHGNECHC